MWRRRSLCLYLAMACGCGSAAVDEAEPQVPVAPSQSASETTAPASDEATTAKISGFEFAVPPGWRRVQLDGNQLGFIDARFEVPDIGPDVSITLSTVGGGIDANISRWSTQFGGIDPQTETLDVDGINVTWVDLAGSFQGMGGPSRDNWRMLGAAFQGSPNDFYVKITGPAGAIETIHDDARAFVESTRLAE